MKHLAERLAAAQAIAAAEAAETAARADARQECQRLRAQTVAMHEAWQKARNAEIEFREAIVNTPEITALRKAAEAAVLAIPGSVVEAYYGEGFPLRCGLTGLPVIEGDRLIGDPETYCILRDAVTIKDGLPELVDAEQDETP